MQPTWYVLLIALTVWCSHCAVNSSLCFLIVGCRSRSNMGVVVRWAVVIAHANLTSVLCWTLSFGSSIGTYSIHCFCLWNMTLVNAKHVIVFCSFLRSSSLTRKYSFASWPLRRSASISGERYEVQNISPCKPGTFQADGHNPHSRPDVHMEWGHSPFAVRSRECKRLRSLWGNQGNHQ